MPPAKVGPWNYAILQSGPDRIDPTSPVEDAGARRPAFYSDQTIGHPHRRTCSMSTTSWSRPVVRPDSTTALAADRVARSSPPGPPPLVHPPP